MHMIKTYESLRNKLEREVEDINKEQLSRESLEILHHLTKTLCALDCLIDSEYEKEEGYSNGYYNNDHSYRMIPRMSNGRYGRDGDGDGRYGESSRDNFRYSSSRGWNGEYSRDNARQKLIQKLETLKDDTMSDRERASINNCINDINS